MLKVLPSRPSRPKNKVRVFPSPSTVKRLVGKDKETVRKAEQKKDQSTERIKARLSLYAGLNLELNNRLQHLAQLEYSDQEQPLPQESRAEAYAREIAPLLQANRQLRAFYGEDLLARAYRGTGFNAWKNGGSVEERLVERMEERRAEHEKRMAEILGMPLEEYRALMKARSCAQRGGQAGD